MTSPLTALLTASRRLPAPLSSQFVTTMVVVGALGTVATAAAGAGAVAETVGAATAQLAATQAASARRLSWISMLVFIASSP
jgi:hypothetical protein